MERREEKKEGEEERREDEHTCRRNKMYDMYSNGHFIFVKLLMGNVVQR